MYGIFRDTAYMLINEDQPTTSSSTRLEFDDVVCFTILPFALAS